MQHKYSFIYDMNEMSQIQQCHGHTLWFTFSVLTQYIYCQSVITSELPVPSLALIVSGSLKNTQVFAPATWFHLYADITHVHAMLI